MLPAGESAEAYIVPNTTNAMIVNFNNGNVNNNNKTNNYYVRPVRGGAWDLFSFRNIYQCYLNCRRKKRNTANALRFEMNLEDNICKLEMELKTRTYQPARSVCFVAKKPKFREVFAADFRDRVVHHILIGYLEKIFEPIFIYDAWACRKNKGTQAAVKRLQKFSRSVTSNGTRQAFYLQLDIKSFFVNINKEILFNIIRRKTDNADILWLLERVLNNDCTKNYVFKGNKRLLKLVPPHKTLFNAAPHKGLPIGNLTSQFFANVYLNELDQFVKHILKARYYVRYVDDFVLMSCHKEQLDLWKREIEIFLRTNLDLDLNPKREKLRPVSDGIDFLGYIVRPDYMLVRRRVVNNCKEKLRLIEQRLKPAEDNILKFPPDIVRQTQESFSSYMAHFNLANSHNLKESLHKRFPWLNEFLKLSPLVTPRFFPGMMSQWAFFNDTLLKNVREPWLLFFQVGRFYKFYGSNNSSSGGDVSHHAPEVLGLRIKPGRAAATHPSSSHHDNADAGFPVRLEKRYTAIAIKKGYSCYIVNQAGGDYYYYVFTHRQMPRVLTRKYLPSPSPHVQSTQQQKKEEKEKRLSSL